jgi:hypothetical protein
MCQFEEVMAICSTNGGRVGFTQIAVTIIQLSAEGSVSRSVCSILLSSIELSSPHSLPPFGKTSPCSCTRDATTRQTKMKVTHSREYEVTLDHFVIVAFVKDHTLATGCNNLAGKKKQSFSVMFQFWTRSQTF